MPSKKCHTQEYTLCDSTDTECKNGVQGQGNGDPRGVERGLVGRGYSGRLCNYESCTSFVCIIFTLN